MTHVEPASSEGDDFRPAVFLDRDGTVVVEADYLSDPADVRLVPQAPPAIRSLRGAGFAVVIVTNQSGIARGLYTVDQYRDVARRVEELLVSQGAAPDGVYFCPHHPDFSGPCDCRKPDLGMYRSAARDLGLALARSWYVGDKPTDLAPAGRLGGRAVLVRTGYGEETLAAGSLPAGTAVVEHVGGAAELILAVGSGV